LTLRLNTGTVTLGVLRVLFTLLSDVDDVTWFTVVMEFVLTMLLTVTLMIEEVLLAEVSYAMAISVWDPLLSLVLSHGKEERFFVVEPTRIASL
jgi:hypothetical protein